MNRKYSYRLKLIYFILYIYMFNYLLFCESISYFSFKIIKLNIGDTNIEHKWIQHIAGKGAHVKLSTNEPTVIHWYIPSGYNVYMSEGPVSITNFGYPESCQGLNDCDDVTTENTEYSFLFEEV